MVPLATGPPTVATVDAALSQRIVVKPDNRDFPESVPEPNLSEQLPLLGLSFPSNPLLVGTPSVLAATPKTPQDPTAPNPEEENSLAKSVAPHGDLVRDLPMPKISTSPPAVSAALVPSGELAQGPPLTAAASPSPLQEALRPDTPTKATLSVPQRHRYNVDSKVSKSRYIRVPPTGHSTKQTKEQTTKQVYVRYEESSETDIVQDSTADDVVQEAPSSLPEQESGLEDTGKPEQQDSVTRYLTEGPPAQYPPQQEDVEDDTADLHSSGFRYRSIRVPLDSLKHTKQHTTKAQAPPTQGVGLQEPRDTPIPGLPQDAADAKTVAPLDNAVQGTPLQQTNVRVPAAPAPAQAVPPAVPPQDGISVDSDAPSPAALAPARAVPPAVPPPLDGISLDSNAPALATPTPAPAVPPAMPLPQPLDRISLDSNAHSSVDEDTTAHTSALDNVPPLTFQSEDAGQEGDPQSPNALPEDLPQPTLPRLHPCHPSLPSSNQPACRHL